MIKQLLNELDEAINSKRFQHASAIAMSLLEEEKAFYSALLGLAKIPRLPEKVSNHSLILNELSCELIAKNFESFCDKIVHETSVFEVSLLFIVKLQLASRVPLFLKVAHQAHSDNLRVKLLLLDAEDWDTNLNKVRSVLFSIPFSSKYSETNHQHLYDCYAKLIVRYHNTSDTQHLEEAIEMSLSGPGISERLAFTILNIKKEFEKKDFHKVSALTESLRTPNPQNPLSLLLECKNKWRQGYSKLLISTLDSIQERLNEIEPFFQREYWLLRYQILSKLKLGVEVEYCKSMGQSINIPEERFLSSVFEEGHSIL